MLACSAPVDELELFEQRTYELSSLATLSGVPQARLKLIQHLNMLLYCAYIMAITCKINAHMQNVACLFSVMFRVHMLLKLQPFVLAEMSTQFQQVATVQAYIMCTVGMCRAAAYATC